MTIVELANTIDQVVKQGYTMRDLEVLLRKAFKEERVRLAEFVRAFPVGTETELQYRNRIATALSKL